MKKVFILTNDMNGGGAEKVLLTLLRHIPKQDYQIVLGLVYRRGPHLSDIPADIPVRYLFPENAHGKTSVIRNDKGELYKKIAPLDSDIEVAFLEGNATKILGNSAKSRAKRLAWIHIDLSRMHYTAPSYQSNREEFAIYHSYDKLVFVSHDAQSGFEALFGTGVREKSIVQHNPIDDIEILRAAQAFQVPKRRLTLCASGRLSPEKGFERLLDVVERLQKDGLTFDFWILGDGPLRESLLRRTQRLPRPEAVTFWGFQANPYPYMRTSDIFVSGSFAEGFSTVVGEALILGRRIIATRCCGMEEALQGGIYGKLVENTEDALYLGLKQEIQTCSHPVVPINPRDRFAPYDIQRQLPGILKIFNSI